jgi:hypothetical protein
MKIYLCGGINGLSDEEVFGWRKIAANGLLYDVLDPARRDYRGKEFRHAEEIVTGDLEDVKNCDALLVNAIRPSWGTAMEIVYGKKVFGKKVVCCNTPHLVSPWLDVHSDALFPDVQEAVKYINFAARRW